MKIRDLKKQIRNTEKELVEHQKILKSHICHFSVPLFFQKFKPHALFFTAISLLLTRKIWIPFLKGRMEKSKWDLIKLPLILFLKKLPLK